MKSLFKIPLRAHHGLLLVIKLAQAYENSGSISLKHIAHEEHISQGFLEEIAGLLRRAELIHARRGPAGGYRLAKNPSSITVADVVTAIEGPIAILECLAQGKCMRRESCTKNNVWHTLQKHLLNTMNTTTISQLISKS